MRPDILSVYFRELSTLSGIGARRLAELNKLFEELEYPPTIFDLLCLMPRRLIRRGQLRRIDEATAGQIGSFVVKVGTHKPSLKRHRQPYTVNCYDDSATIDITFFQPMERYIRERLPEGSKRIISGKVEKYRNKLIMAHPDYILPIEQQEQLPQLEPVYSTKGCLSQKQIRYFIAKAFEIASELPEWQSNETKQKYEFTDFLSALRKMHYPNYEAFSEKTFVDVRRLAYDEMFVGQLAVLCVRKDLKKEKGIEFKHNAEKFNKLTKSLPFELTQGQQQAISEITADMAQSHAMLRLVQGDVGCGKTIVAIAAILNAISNGLQAAFMAPTELLARQHYLSCKQYLEPLGGKVILICGSHSAKQKKEIKNIIAAGYANIIIGTHALFQDNIHFKSLGLAVIDEQHRFGVYQRLALQMKTNKAEYHADMIVMTATPIPRSLQLSNYGDMDVSRITGKPPQRKKIHTIALPMKRIDEVIERLQNIFKEGSAVYWVCRRIDEEGDSDLTAVETRYAYLAKKLPDIKMEFLQGRMKAQEKDKAMQRFRDGTSQLAVATTVVEVGVDVPHANVMIIENAEHFGLAQLHQLRGRVGRDQKESFCILIYKEPLSEIARERLNIMRETDNGFVIAEKDLELRGSGEMLGIRQSGLPRWKFFEPLSHGEFLAQAHNDAKQLLQHDPELKSKRGQAAQLLLYLFRRSDTVDLVRSG